MKKLQGTITRLSTPKTATVTVVRQWQHPLYKKSVKRSKHYPSHYESGNFILGEEVVIKECVPKSKTKKFEIIEKVGDAQ